MEKPDVGDAIGERSKIAKIPSIAKPNLDLINVHLGKRVELGL
jgi:hypothetical protein